MDELYAGQAPVSNSERLPGPTAFPVPALLTWLDMTCRAIPGVSTAIIVTAASNEQHSFQLASAWPSTALGLALVAFSERCLNGRKALVETSEGTVIAGIPFSHQGRLRGAFIIKASAGALSEEELRAYAMAAGGYLSRIMLGHLDESVSPEQHSLALKSALLGRVCGPEPFPKTAMETVNWLAGQFGCSRVALGTVRGREIRIEALSHSAWFDRRTREITAIENAMDEALNQRCSVTVPSLPERGRIISVAHCEAANAHAACSVVLAGGNGLGAGVLFLERAADRPFSGGELRILEDLAQLIGPVLETRELAHRWIGGRTYGAWRGFLDRLRDPRRPALRAAMALGPLLLLALLFVETTWRIGADAAIEGEQQRVIPAPFEGFIALAPVKAGMIVRKDDMLAALDTRQTQLDLQRWSAEEAQRRSQYHDALSKHDQALAAIAMAQIQQAEAQRALAQDKLALATMRAPFDAIVVSGDLTQQIGGPVEQGKVLFELAPLDAYRVIARVEDRDVRAVQVGQRGHLMLAGLTGDKLGFVVKNLSVSEAKDGRNTFRVEAQLDKGSVSLRPGMQGVAKIEIGSRSVLWVWTHTAWHWTRLQLWKWIP